MAKEQAQLVEEYVKAGMPREEAIKKAKEAGGPTLVICPTSVAGNWARESERFTPGLSVMVHHGATRAREASWSVAHMT